MMFLRFSVLIFLFANLVMPLHLPAAPSEEGSSLSIEEIHQLIESFSSKKFAIRQAAQAKLLKKYNPNTHKAVLEQVSGCLGSLAQDFHGIEITREIQIRCWRVVQSYAVDVFTERHFAARQWLEHQIKEQSAYAHASSNFLESDFYLNKVEKNSVAVLEAYGAKVTFIRGAAAYTSVTLAEDWVGNGEILSLLRYLKLRDLKLYSGMEDILNAKIPFWVQKKPDLNTWEPVENIKLHIGDISFDLDDAQRLRDVFPDETRFDRQVFYYTKLPKDPDELVDIFCTFFSKNIMNTDNVGYLTTSGSVLLYGWDYLNWLRDKNDEPYYLSSQAPIFGGKLNDLANQKHKIRFSVSFKLGVFTGVSLDAGQIRSDSKSDGRVVRYLAKDSLFEGSGLFTGDTLLKLNGASVKSYATYMKEMEKIAFMPFDQLQPFEIEYFKKDHPDEIIVKQVVPKRLPRP